MGLDGLGVVDEHVSFPICLVFFPIGSFVLRDEMNDYVEVR